MKTVYLVCPETIGRIEPELYGHFTEHIGGVMRDGIWVGKDSPIPNIRGFRRALVESSAGSRRRSSAGRADALRKPIIGGTASGKTVRSARDGGHPMTGGRRPTRSARMSFSIFAAWSVQSLILP